MSTCTTMKLTEKEKLQATKIMMEIVKRAERIERIRKNREMLSANRKMEKVLKVAVWLSLAFLVYVVFNSK